MPSVALHVIEFTFSGGFESLPLRQNFPNHRKKECRNHDNDAKIERFGPDGKPIPQLNP